MPSPLDLLRKAARAQTKISERATRIPEDREGIQQVSKYSQAQEAGANIEDTQVGGLNALLMRLFPEVGKAKSSYKGAVHLQHNIPTRKLLNVLEGKNMLNTNFGATAGMLPNPSIAVLPEGGKLQGFGDISIVFKKEAVTPSEKSALYPRDAYTSRWGDDVERLKELSAASKAYTSGGLSRLAAILNMPKFVSGWREYLDSPFGKGVLTRKNVNYPSLNKRLLEKVHERGFTIDDWLDEPIDLLTLNRVPEHADELSEFDAVTPIAKFLTSMPSKYGELKLADDLALTPDNVAFIAGSNNPNIASMLKEFGLEFVPTKSQLRTELPDIVKERGLLFEAGGGPVGQRQQ